MVKKEYSFDLSEYYGKPCPMCKKHDALIIEEKVNTIIRDTPVEYDEIVVFCSYLGENDPDAYFIPPKVMNENLRRAKESWLRKQLDGGHNK